MSSLPPGWTESRPGALATNHDPVRGGIVDSATVSGRWFVILNNDDLGLISETFDTRDDAFAAWSKAVSKIDEFETFKMAFRASLLKAADQCSDEHGMTKIKDADLPALFPVIDDLASRLYARRFGFTYAYPP